LPEECWSPGGSRGGKKFEEAFKHWNDSSTSTLDQ
jgi:hypothetical protein